ncbi:cysteine desulfurase [Ruminiclostridium sufflavum DSM 19573]|uniref:Cysteine desulfurase IscS n=1 Tax=Ruminiclostridium sufflavum DSM 19573 TaxID=1121337 RepID=A0A318XK89_9FIRM|nr:cysteine desulfurase NifS [Ruminiclostridium sufflavum]PYG87453.1 cysteine desulfurase [Ruminiclostridium sufflavum DSM 19573]
MVDRIIYLDHAATTYVKPEVFDAMKPYFSEHFGNASSIYSIGRESKKAVEEAREKVARAIGAQPREIYFTGSGSEADNWALKGVAAAYKQKGKHIITSKIEHPAVLNTCKYLEKEGFEVTYLPVDGDGLVSLEDVRNAIKENTILISIMFANNEIGTIQPINEIGAIAREKGVLFHTDAVQAVGNVAIDVEELNVDLLSLSGHKFYGPKGVGALYVRKGVKISSLIHGGQQERGKRASTENIPSIVGLGRAIELATENMEEYNKRITELREKTIEGLMAKVPYIKLNGHRTKRLPGNVNISFQFIEGESLLLMLDMKGVCGSSGSACSSGSLDPSHVLLAIGLTHEIAHGSLRLSFGDDNTLEDVEYLLKEIPNIVSRLRDMSPLYEAVKNKQKQ